MIGWIHARLPDGGFWWLVLHELRLAMRGRKRGWTQFASLAILLIWCAVGVGAGLLLMRVPIAPSASIYTGIATGTLAAFSFMLSGAMVGSQDKLYGTGDLELLFTAPIPPRRVIAAKLAGIVAAIGWFYALMVLPIAVPVAAIGHPGLFGVVALLVALTLSAACIGLGITLAIARIAGPRAARTAGQIAAALTGGALFLGTQMLGQGEGGHSRNGFAMLFEWMRKRGIGAEGISALPGRAAFGDPLAIAVVLGIGVGLFVIASAGMQTLFLAGFRDGRMRLSRRRPRRGGIGRHFHKRLGAAVFAKEWRLLARDPQIVFQMLLRLVYLAPLIFLLLRSSHDFPVAPGLAFASVAIAGQLVGSLTWLAVAAEDAPDLITIAPVAKARIDEAKLRAAFTMALPLLCLLPVAIAFESPPGALATLAITCAAGWATGLLEIAHAKPQPRSRFNQRRQGSWLRGLLQFALTGTMGGAAAAIVYFMEHGLPKFG